MIEAIFLMATLMATQCEISLSSVQHYEDEILRAIEREDHPTVHSSLQCLLLNQTRLSGKEQIVSQSFVNGLLGRELPVESKDPRYVKLQSWLKSQLMKKESQASGSFLASIASQRTSQLEPFCRDGKHGACQVFLPSNEQIVHSAPLIAAIHVLHLHRSKRIFSAEMAAEIDNQLRQLLAQPDLDELVKKTLDEILSPRTEPLSMA